MAAAERRTAAAELAADLPLDAGYLSRLAARAVESRLSSRRESFARRRPQDAVSRLTDTGRDGFRAAGSEIATRPSARGSTTSRPASAPRALSRRRRRSKRRIRGASAVDPTCSASHRPGDIGWITHRQGKLYAEEYGWDETYEALVAEILAALRQERSTPAK